MWASEEAGLKWSIGPREFGREFCSKPLLFQYSLQIFSDNLGSWGSWLVYQPVFPGVGVPFRFSTFPSGSDQHHVWPRYAGS